MKRIILLSVLAIEGAGGILGGILLLIAPDGSLMNIPIGVMHGAFPNFFIPGALLTMMGLLTTTAFIAVLIKSKVDLLLAELALIGFTIWFSVEITILRQLHWLLIIWGVPVLIGLWAAFSLMPNSKKTKLR